MLLSILVILGGTGVSPVASGLWPGAFISVQDSFVFFAFFRG
jgi:hypothetical protein